MSLERRHVCNVCLVEPLDPEVAVEVGGRLAQATDGVVLQRVLDVDGEQSPDGARRQLKRKFSLSNISAYFSLTDDRNATFLLPN